ncbi:maturation control protein [Enterobacter soli]|uniref:maturation control protein n=1 Tax=Enterobacter soli TaxID=885040 RepID=UPI002F41E095
MAASEMLPPARMKLEEILIPQITDLEAKGFEVLVDETSDFITARAGVRIRLGDIGNQGKPILVEALDIFRELERQKAITFPKNAASRFRLPETILDMERNAKGETTYRIDWSQLRSEHVLSMLCCYATSFHNVASLGYLKAMYGPTEYTPPADPLDPLRTVLKAVERDAWINGPRSELTGKGNYL